MIYNAFVKEKFDTKMQSMSRKSGQCHLKTKKMSNLTLISLMLIYFASKQ